MISSQTVLTVNTVIVLIILTLFVVLYVGRDLLREKPSKRK
jgi:hypothetical protein